MKYRIFTTTFPTGHRLPTLMHDPKYRLAIAWQNVGYNQPPHPGFFFGDGMKPVARQLISHSIAIMDHEEAFVSVFVVPEKRMRYLEFLRKPKRRAEILNRFCHFFDFLPQLATQVARDSALAALLRKQGAGMSVHVLKPQCYCQRHLPRIRLASSMSGFSNALA